MSEEQFTIPKTDEGTRFIERAGVFLLSPISVTQNVDDKGVPKNDKNGNPGIKITFRSDKGEVISATYYYSKYPFGDARREDPNLKCGSEFWLTNLKAVLGFKANEEIPPEKFMKGKFWGRVKEIRLKDKKTGEIVKTYWELNRSKYDVYNPQLETKGRPSISGDPEFGPLGGEFVEVKDDFRTGGGESAAKPAGPKAQPRDEVARPEESQDDGPGIDSETAIPDF